MDSSVTMKSWIYIATNESFPDLIKIGFSERHPVARMEELSNTSVPTPFLCAYCVCCKDADRLEKELHRLLNDYRYTKNREFFTCDPEQAVEVLNELLESSDIFDPYIENYLDSAPLKCSPIDIQKAFKSEIKDKRNILSSLKKKLKKNGDISAIDYLVDIELLLLRCGENGIDRIDQNRICKTVNKSDFFNRDSINQEIQDEIKSHLASTTSWFFHNESDLQGRIPSDLRDGAIEQNETFKKCGICRYMTHANLFKQSKNGSAWFICPKCGLTFRQHI